MSETPNDPYVALIGLLRSGARVDIEHVDRVLSESKHTARDLVAALASRPRSAQPGDPCHECGGRLHVYHTHTEGGKKTQYLRCRQCGSRPKQNKRVVLL